MRKKLLPLNRLTICKDFEPSSDCKKKKKIKIIQNNIIPESIFMYNVSIK